MKTKSKVYVSILLIAIAISGCLLWLSNHPVEIVAIHNKYEFSAVLVKNFPLTDKGKINWWLKNKEMLKDKYNIPSPAGDGLFSITFWDFGDGYKEDKYDRRCFDDMKTSKNCIDKNAVFSVSNNRDNTVSFKVYDGSYLLKENGEIVEIENN